MRTCKNVLLFTCVGIVALLFQHVVVYRLLMIPLLSSLQAVPFYWWLCYLTPVTLVLLIGGVRARTIREVAISVVLLSFAATGLAYVWAKTSQPGFYKRLELDLLAGLFIDMVFHVVVFGAVMIIGWGVGVSYSKSLGRLLGGKRKRR